MNTRPRSCSERDRREDLLDHLLAGAVGRVGLAGEDDLDRTLLVPQQLRQPLDVGEEQAGPLVRREAAGKADRQDLRVERRLREHRATRRRLAVAGELVPQPAAGRRSAAPSFCRWCASHSSVAGIASSALPEPAGLARASRSSRSASRCLVQCPADLVADPAGHVDAVRDRRGSRSARCRDHVAVGGLGVEAADGVRAVRSGAGERGHVELVGSASTPSPSSRTASTGTPPVDRAAVAVEERSGDAAHEVRCRSARCRPTTGVWIVKTLLDRTRSQRLVERGAVGDVLAGPLSEEEGGVALVEVPDGRVDAERPEWRARRRRREPAPGGAASPGRGRRGCA